MSARADWPITVQKKVCRQITGQDRHKQLAGRDIAHGGKRKFQQNVSVKSSDIYR